MKLISLLLVFCLATPASAAVYKTVRPDGSVVYSDQPPRNEAEPHPLPPLQMIPSESLAPAPAPQERNDSKTNTPAAAEAYRSLAILDPQADGTVRDASGQVVVQVALDPPLATEAGDRVIIYLDGEPLAQGTDTAYTLDNVDRGTHTVEASVSSGPGRVLIRSPAVTFHVQRTSVNAPARR